jgi:hypothetical protein
MAIAKDCVIAAKTTTLLMAHFWICLCVSECESFMCH